LSDIKFMCKAPWVSMAFQPSGKVGPCCVYDLNHLQDIASTVEDTFKYEREEFLKGNVPLGCKKCHDSFLQTGKSKAIAFDRYKTDFITPDLQEINVKANNICNLTCRSCGTHFSSKWEEEFNSVVVITKDTAVLEKLKLIDMTTLRTLVIAGGEPTMTQEHVAVLQKLVDIGHTHLEIRISTNLTNLKYKQIDLVELWKKFPRLYLQLSIDGVENNARNIRSGTNWAEVERNLKTIIDNKIPHYINITVSALNIWFLEDTLTYLKNKCNVEDVRFGLVFGPEALSVQVIPAEYRATLNQMIDRLSEAGYNLQQVKTYFNNNNKEDLWPKFLIYNLMLDQTRKENFFESLPIKKDLIDRWLKI